LCQSCSTSSLNSRRDTLTVFTTVIVNGCKQAITTCVGQTTTEHIDYFIEYADNTSRDNNSFTGVAYTFVCNSAGQWTDPIVNKVVSDFFCYEVITSSDCTTCTATGTTTSPTFDDINVPLYNRTATSPNS
jgi:hypothetical protein